jgi:hypothetical protein
MEDMTLRKLVDLLEGCLSNEEVTDDTRVRIAPEFGVALDLLLSGVGIRYSLPAGGTPETDPPPDVVLEFRRAEA